MKARKPKVVVASRLPLSSAKESWSAKESATGDLHCEYWSTVFSMNNWKLYNRCRSPTR